MVFSMQFYFKSTLSVFACLDPLPKDSVCMTQWKRPFKNLTLSQTTKFRLFQIQRVCRQQILNLMKMAESSPNG